MTKAAEKTKPAKGAESVRRNAEWPPAFYLGRELRERVSGLTGICTFLSHQPTGMWMVGVQPKATKDGTAPESHMYDEPRIEVIGDGLLADTPKPLKPAFEIGDWVEHRVSPFRGVVMSLHWSLNGCVTYNVASGALNDQGKTVHQAFLEPEIRRVADTPRLEIMSAKAPTGGPAQRAQTAVR